MTDIASFAQILLVTALTSLPIIALVHVVRGDDPVTLADVAYGSAGRSWPRGVQEEEPAPWGAVPAR